MSTDPRDDGTPADRALERAWRAGSGEQPPARIDAAILAAAHAEAARARAEAVAGRRWWTHWQPLAAAAGVAGLAFVVVQMLPREPQPRAVQKLEAPAADGNQARQAPGAAVSAEADAGVGASGLAERALRRPAEAAAPVPSASDWARQVESLYRAGDEAAAAEALRAFRAAYPEADDYLSADLRHWAEQSAAAVAPPPGVDREPLAPEPAVR